MTTRTQLLALAICLIVAVSFFPAYQAGFVWDDVVFTEEPVIRSPSGLRNIWFSPRDIENEGHYWPVTYTTFWLEHKLWGFEPLGFHVVNVLLHLVNSLLVWRLLTRLRAPGAWVAAALFAAHPLHVESVVWIIERKDVLSGFFYLTSFLTYIAFVERGGRRRLLGSLALFLAGMLSKTVVVTLPAALLIWHWSRRGQLKKADILRSAPFFAVGLAVALADTAFYRTREILELDYSVLERILIAARALWFYVGKLLWPTDLAVIYPLWDIRPSNPLAWLFVAGAVALPLALWLGRGRWGRGPLACVAFFGATLSPALGLIPYGYMQFSLVADRFQYLAGIGVLALIAGVSVRILDPLPAVWTASARVGLAAALIVLGALTVQHAARFHDNLTLFSHIVSRNPLARDAHVNLGQALNEAGRFEESLKAGRTAVELRPASAPAHSNLGLALLEFERFDEADESFARAIELQPRHRSAHQNLAESLKRQGRHDEAAARYRQVLQLDPGFSLAWVGLADALLLAERHEDALNAASRALEIEPDSPNLAPLHLLMGRASRETGRLEAAERHFLLTAELVPETAEPLRELANLYLLMDRLDDAAAYADRARRIEPASAANLHMRAETVRRQDRPDEALALYREALRIEPDFAPAIAGLGIALFELGRHDEAIEQMEQALAIDPDQDVASSLHRLTGQAHQEQGRIDEAVAAFERALRLDPRDADALDRLAFIRFNAGRATEAVALYRSLVDLDETNALARTNLGIALLSAGRPEEAARTLEGSLELNPDQPMARAALADARRLSPGGDD